MRFKNFLSIKTEGKRIISLFGITIYECYPKKLSRVQKILEGLICTTKTQSFIKEKNFFNHKLVLELNLDGFDNEKDLLRCIFENFDNSVSREV